MSVMAAAVIFVGWKSPDVPVDVVAQSSDVRKAQLLVCLVPLMVTYSLLSLPSPISMSPTLKSVPL